MKSQVLCKNSIKLKPNCKQLCRIKLESDVYMQNLSVCPDAKDSPFGRGVTAGDGEGKLGAKEPPYSDKQTLCQRDVIAVSVLFVSGLALSGASRQGRVAAPSVCLAVAHILLAAAPTAPPCFRHWRRSSLLPPKGEPYPLYLLCARPSLPSMMSVAAAAMSGQRSARALASSGGNLPSTQSAKS